LNGFERDALGGYGNGWVAAMDVHTGVKTTNAKTVRVLFVEDEFFIREWIAQALAEQGFAVESVTNAADALFHISRAPIDVLLTDINLPGGMDGTALARRARELRPDLTVIYASAHAASLKQVVRVPGSMILSKPYEPGVVGRLVAAAARAPATVHA
jgi:DNA-binding NtrC family response regulator